MLGGGSAAAAEHGDALFTLGTAAGPPLVARRRGPGTALLVNGSVYVIDCGRGTADQFSDVGLDYQDLRALFLTHLHADHITDYYSYFLCGGWSSTVVSTPGDPPFPPAPRNTVRVFGPGSAGALPPSRVAMPTAEVGRTEQTPGTVAMTGYLHDAYAYSSNIFNRDAGVADIRTLVAAHDIELPSVGANANNTAPAMDPFEVYADENVRVSAILVPHYDVFPSFGYRFDLASGVSIAFSGDTRKSANVVRLARGADILVHESIFELTTTYHQRSHTSAVEVGEVASAAGTGHVILSHYDPPDLPDARWIEAVGKAYRGRISVAKEGNRFPIG